MTGASGSSRVIEVRNPGGIVGHEFELEGAWTDAVDRHWVDSGRLPVRWSTVAGDSFESLSGRGVDDLVVIGGAESNQGLELATSLEHLGLWHEGSGAPLEWSFFRQLRTLRGMALDTESMSTLEVDDLEIWSLRDRDLGRLPLSGRLRRLRLAEARKLKDVTRLGSAEGLEALDISYAPLSGFADVAPMSTLESLTLSACPSVVDLAWLRHFPGLTTLTLENCKSIDSLLPVLDSNVETLIVTGSTVPRDRKYAAIAASGVRLLVERLPRDADMTRAELTSAQG